MTTTRSTTEMRWISNLQSDLNTSCLPTNNDVLHNFFHIFKNQITTTNDAVKQVCDLADIENSYEK